MLGSIFENDHIQSAIQRYIPNTPVIISNGFMDIENIYSISVDHDFGLQQAIAHLIKKKKNRIAFLYYTPTPNSYRKATAFEHAIRHCGVPDIHYGIIPSSDTAEDAEAFSKQILKAAKEYSAIIFSEDLFALQAINCLKRNGYRVPEDVAVIGYENSIFSICSDPTITTIDTKIVEMSTIIANTIHDVFASRLVGRLVTIRPELIVRGST